VGFLSSKMSLRGCLAFCLFTLMQIRIRLISLMRIRIRLFTLMRIRIRLSKIMRIHADPDLQHWYRYLTTNYNT
jgi:hypothetical protein